MKKFTCLLVILALMMSSTALADEILFRDIPWGSNTETVLTSMGLIDTDVYRALPESERVHKIDSHLLYAPWSHIEPFGSGRITEYNQYEGGYKYSPMMGLPGDITVGEYELENLELQFMYGVNEGVVSTAKEDAEFISGKYYIRIEADKYGVGYDKAYKDLLDKLTWLYGKPSNNEENPKYGYWIDGGYRYSIWFGDNNTGVILYHSSDQYDTEISIEYGRTDIEGDLVYIQEYLDENKRDEKYNDSNTDGL